MSERARKPWFREGMPWWAWAFLVASRVAAIVPLVLVALFLWWWTHGGAERAPGMARHAAARTSAWVDSIFGR